MSKIYTRPNGNLFQDNKDVNAVRVKNLLHIFTGTYPLYYKGDGKLYAYPRYLPNPTQVLRFGHNVMSDDFESQYRFDGITNVLDNQLNTSPFKNISLLDLDRAPVFLSQNEPVNYEVSYNYSTFHEDEVTQFLPENYKGVVNSFANLPAGADPGDIYYVRDETLDFIGFYSRGAETSQILFSQSYSAEPFRFPTYSNVNFPFQFPVDPKQLKVYSKAASAFGDEEVLIYDGSKLNQDSSYTGETITTVSFSHTYNAEINIVNVAEDSILDVGFTTQIAIKITRDNEEFPYFQVSRSGETEEEAQNASWDITFSGTSKQTGNTFKPIDEVRFEVVSTEDSWVPYRFNATPLRELSLRIYQRPAAVLGTAPEEWVEVQDYTSTMHSNGNFQTSGMRIVSPESLEISLVTPPDNIIAQPLPLQATINNLPVANHNWDFRIDLVERIRRYEEVRTGVGENRKREARLVDREVIRNSKIQYDILVSPFRLSNFPTNEFPNRTFSKFATWSANKVLEHFGKLMVYGSEEMPDNIFISAPEDVSLFYFPHLFRKELLTDAKEPIESVVPFSSILVAQTPNRTWGIKGNSSVAFLDEDGRVENPNVYTVFDINTGVGTIAYKTVRPVRNQLYFLSNQGIMSMVSLYATDDKYNVRPLDRNINNIVPMDKQAIAIQHDNQYWINFPKTGEVFRFYIDQQAWMKDSFKNFKESNGWFWVSTKDGVLRFITRAMILENNEENYSIYEGIVNKGIPTDFGKNIKSIFLTANLDQDQPFHTKRYRELKFSFALQNQYLPPLKPITNQTSKVGNDYIVQFKGTRFHTYNVEFTLPNNATTYAFSSLPEYNIQVLDALGENNEPLTVQKQDNNSFDVFLGNYEGDVLLTVKDVNGNVIQDDDVVVTDVTYDFNIQGFTLVDSDGNTINRIPFVQFESQKEAFDQSLGTRFSQFELGRTPFGDIKRNVQTIRLSGSGYQIAIMVEDESRSKWTLETLGIQFRMRKTRSR